MRLNNLSLSYDEIRSLSLQFRKAIEEVRDNDGFFKWRFNRPDLMSSFPNGCCEDATDLFAYYLKQYHEIETTQSNGIFRSNNPEDTRNHVWLTFCSKDLIVDLTYDQFYDYHKDERRVYIGPVSKFHKSLERVTEYENSDISKDDRLKHDYCEIVKRLGSEV